jgi:hypothetical protein
MILIIPLSVMTGACKHDRQQSSPLVLSSWISCRYCIQLIGELLAVGGFTAEAGENWPGGVGSGGGGRALPANLYRVQQA